MQINNHFTQNAFSNASCSCCNNEPQTELIHDDFVFVSANISSMVREGNWNDHNLEYLKYYDRLYKLCNESNPDEINSFSEIVCYNCLTRTVQKSIRHEIMTTNAETNSYRNGIQVLKSDNEKIHDIEDHTEEFKQLRDEDNKLCEEIKLILQECEKMDKEIEKEEEENSILEKESNELLKQHHSNLSEFQQLEVALYEIEKEYELKKSLYERISSESSLHEIFFLFNHEFYGSINGLKLDRISNSLKIDEFNASLGHFCTLIFKITEWMETKFSNSDWKGIYLKSYSLVPLGSKAYFESRTDFTKYPLYQETINVVGWLSSFLTESYFDKAMVILLNYVFEMKNVGHFMNHNLFFSIKHIKVSYDKIDINGELFSVKLNEGKPELWGKSINILAKIISFFLLWIEDDQMREGVSAEKS